MDTLLSAGVLGALVGAGYVGIGVRLARGARGRPLMRGFVAFWCGVGGYMLVEAAWVLLAVAGFAPFWVGLVVLHAKIALLLAGFGGLVAYLLGIYTGRRGVTWIAAGAYALLWSFVEFVYMVRAPVGEHLGTWGLQLDYARPNVEPLWTLMLALMIVPPTLAALAYAALWRASNDESQRRRILLTSASLLAFFLPSFVAWRAGSWYWWGPTEKLLSVVAALGMLASLHLARSEEGSLARARQTLALERTIALRQRVKDLL